jgi:hypothetical protein
VNKGRTPLLHPERSEVSSTIDLTGKTAFVTGSTRGIGLAIARAL